jgi:hypothetical protein
MIDNNNPTTEGYAPARERTPDPATVAIGLLVLVMLGMMAWLAVTLPPAGLVFVGLGAAWVGGGAVAIAALGYGLARLWGWLV